MNIIIRKNHDNCHNIQIYGKLKKIIIYSKTDIMWHWTMLSQILYFILHERILVYVLLSKRGRVPFM